jgi:hypothetical protein
VLALALPAASFARGLPARVGYPLDETNLHLIWSAPTNDLPRRLWTYHAVPTRIPAQAVSNLVALGSFTAKDRKNVPNYPLTLSYDDPSGQRKLWIVPDWWDVYYRDQEADDLNKAEGVPNETRTFQLATNLLPKLGIDITMLARKPGTPELRVGRVEAKAMLWHGPGGGLPYATNLHTRGIIFIRSLDGVDFEGFVRGGCTIEFGSHGKVSKIQATWRKLKRDELYPVASPQRMMQWIHEGKAKYLPGKDWPDPLTPADTLTVTKVTPYYYAEALGEFEKPNGKVYPYAELEARFDLSSTNTPTFIFCPLLEDKPLPH